MSFVHLQDDRGAGALADVLRSNGRIALDCEAAGFHRYSDRICLIQLTTAEETYVLDPLAFDPSGLLREPLERDDVEIVMHGADYDLRLLARDLGIRLRGLYDTQVAASLVGEDGLGLAALLEKHLGVTLSKAHQRADWAQRPLPESMLEYAASDTRHLLALADILKTNVGGAGRSDWVAEECRVLEAVSDPLEEDGPTDPVVRVKGARDLAPRQVTALRSALEWRDGIARSRDRAPFRVVGDMPLLEATLRKPRRTRDLERIKGFPRGLARSEGDALIALLRGVDDLPDHDLRPFPRPERRGPGRPTPEEEELASRLKEVRNLRADELGLARGTLLSNAMLLAIARAAPRSLEAIAAVPGLKRWQVTVLGESLLDVVRDEGR